MAGLVPAIHAVPHLRRFSGGTAWIGPLAGVETEAALHCGRGEDGDRKAVGQGQEIAVTGHQRIRPGCHGQFQERTVERIAALGDDRGAAPGIVTASHQGR